MFKKFLIVVAAMLASTSVLADRVPGMDHCNIKSDEELVCSVVMCSVGLAISESRDECLKVNRDFAIYLATLGFWDKPPKCRMRDESCKKVGKATTASLSPEQCVELPTEDKQSACLAALGAAPDGYCDKFSGAEKIGCEDAQATGNFSEEYCSQLAEEKDSGRWSFLTATELEKKEELYNKCLAINRDDD
jgi:hypothetical protein